MDSVASHHRSSVGRDHCDYDVAIVGGGVVGLSLAIALKQALGGGLRVALWDRAPGRRSPRQRVTAITAGPRRMLAQLGVWPEIETKAQPINRMDVTDSRLSDPVRPVFLSFSGAISRGEPFAHVVFNADLEDALENKARKLNVEIRAEEAVGVTPFRGGVRLEPATNQEGARARLVVAADGMRSPLREAVGIESIGWDYRLRAIVCAVEHEQEHEGVAYEHFLPSGPFATLPLCGRRSSIVWTEPEVSATRIARLPPAEFRMALRQRLGERLGRLEVREQPLTFPISLNVARRLVTDRLALIGDAAHVIHPLAGQGLNLGVRDAAALAESIVDAVRLGEDPGSHEVLRLYEKRRRFDNTLMAAATDLLHNLFSSDGSIRPVRDLGLGLVDRAPPLKRLFMYSAAGVVGDVPRLLLGEKL